MLQPAEEPIVEFKPLAVLRLLRVAGRALLAQAALHGQLAQQEWAQEKTRLQQLLLAGLLGFACLLVLLLLLNALLLALSWDTPYRFATLLGLPLSHALGCALAWRRIRMLLARGDTSFAATREELATDITLLKSKL
ncbi:phage holin family protein [Pseudomonas sp. CAU 1711]|uniref:phage holin family protein n=1 Tax=Pseudomonas sp. CAU 1711 TaxID=3140356 RepID=UPI003260F6F9